MLLAGSTRFLSLGRAGVDRAPRFKHHLHGSFNAVYTDVAEYKSRLTRIRAGWAPAPKQAQLLTPHNSRGPLWFHTSDVRQSVAMPAEQTQRHFLTAGPRWHASIGRKVGSTHTRSVALRNTHTRTRIPRPLQLASLTRTCSQRVTARTFPTSPAWTGTLGTVDHFMQTLVCI